MTVRIKLTTKSACRVARMDRDRLNEHISAGRFPCAPETTTGRARLFDPDDMIALWLFRELMDDGLDAGTAGYTACKVAEAAREAPDAPTISYVEDYFRGARGSSRGRAFPTEQVPPPEKWDSVFMSGTDIRKVTTFRISKLRAMISHYTEEERAIVGADD